MFIKINNYHNATTCCRLFVVYLGQSGKGLVGRNQLDYPKIYLKFYIAEPLCHGF